MRQRLLERRQMKRHVTDRFGRRLPFVQRDRNVFIPDRDAILERELRLQPERALESLRAPLRMTHRQPKVPDDSNLKRNCPEEASRSQADFLKHYTVCCLGRFRLSKIVFLVAIVEPAAVTGEKMFAFSGECSSNSR